MTTININEFLTSFTKANKAHKDELLKKLVAQVNDLTEERDKYKKELEEVQAKSAAASSDDEGEGKKKKRPPTLYTAFMKEEMAKLDSSIPYAKRRETCNEKWRAHQAELGIKVKSPRKKAASDSESDEEKKPRKTKATKSTKGKEADDTEEKKPRKKRNTKKADSSDDESKPKKAPTAYNLFMKEEIAKIKAAQPGIIHKEAFNEATKNWKDAPENPKNQPAAEK